MEPDPQISCTSPTSQPAKVRISDYDPTWPLRYAEEETLLRAALGSLMLAVEHIGSTSVPGTPPKPTIDVLLGLSGYERFNEVVHALQSVDYLYTPEAEADDPADASSGRDLRSRQARVRQGGRTPGRRPLTTTPNERAL